MSRPQKSPRYVTLDQNVLICLKGILRKDLNRVLIPDVSIYTTVGGGERSLRYTATLESPLEASIQLETSPSVL